MLCWRLFAWMLVNETSVTYFEINVLIYTGLLIFSLFTFFQFLFQKEIQYAQTYVIDKPSPPALHFSITRLVQWPCLYVSLQEPGEKTKNLSNHIQRIVEYAFRITLFKGSTFQMIMCNLENYILNDMKYISHVQGRNRYYRTSIGFDC